MAPLIKEAMLLNFAYIKITIQIYSDGHHLVAFPISDADQKTYWVKRDLIESQQINTDSKDKGTILFNSLNVLYEENPIKFIFQEESAQGSSDECLVDLTTCKSCTDCDGNLWYEVKLPFDDKGFVQNLVHVIGLIEQIKKRVG